MTNKPLRIGMVGLDTSHVSAFAAILMDEKHEHHLPGATVSAAWPGGSADFELSHSRVEGFTKTLRDQYNVDILDSPEAVAEACDVLFIESVDGRVHLEMLQRTISAGKPTFIDKPFATTLADAKAMVDLASKHKVPLMSCSSLRYANSFVEALVDESDGKLVGLDTVGPMALQPTQPGLFWYGIHCVEMLVTALGAGCVRVFSSRQGDHELVTATWKDGRVGTFHGVQKAHSTFGVTLHREKGIQQINASTSQPPFYVGNLKAILDSLPHGKSDIPAEEMLEVVRIIEAAGISHETGKAVDLTKM